MKGRPFITFFLPLWVVLALWQAFFTQLLPDEAYYWLYAQSLSWGYFDHPPMIALLIKLGSVIFAGEWGVRCLIVLLSTATLWLTYKITEPQDEWLFCTILMSIVPLHLLLPFAVPDVPLIFFTALFLYGLKYYLVSRGRNSVTIVLIAMVGMLYSKYHVALILFFTVLAVPTVFIYPSFYSIMILSAGLYLPHLYWQYAHDFKSIKYHLIERSEQGYFIKNTIDYLFGQLLMFGPLASISLLYGACTYKVSTSWERVLQFNLIGFIAFFGLMSYRGHIEPNWTTPCWVPFIYLSYRYLENREKGQKWLRKVALISLVGLIAARFFLTIPYEGKSIKLYHDYHKWKTWAAAVKKEANGNPVLFLNTYQYPSEYMFYTGDTAFSHNHPYARSNQFDYWHYEENLIGKKNLLISPGWFVQADQRFTLPCGDTIPYRWITYYGFGKIRFRLLDKPVAMQVNQTYPIRCIAESRYDNPQTLHTASALSPTLYYLFVSPSNFKAPVPTSLTLNQCKLNDTLYINLKAPVEPGRYVFYLCLQGTQVLLSTNSEPLNIVVR